jgi:ferric-dicitrate binding protein FerR (iron transport regulator)
MSEKKALVNYRVEDFVADESFCNYYFHLNKKDRIFWEKWLMENSSKKKLAIEAREIIQSLSLTLNEKEYQQEFEKIKAAIDKKETLQLSRFLNWNKDYRRRKTSRKFLVIALLFLIAGAVYILTQPSSAKKYFSLHQIANNGSKPMSITLNDSTVVTLSPGSKLDYPKLFEGKNREVYLQGEAGFHVKRNEKFPFKVHSKNIVTTVLGTIFNIKKTGDSAIVVELLSGKLKVEIEDATSKSPQSLFLNPDEKATYVLRDNYLYKNVKTARFDINFSRSSFDEIAARIKDVFGKTVINQSDKKNWRFTGDFKNTTAKEIIENICLIKNLNSKEEGDTIFISN